MTVINTQTIVSQNSSNLWIYTWYQNCLNYLQFFINGIPRKIEGVYFKEGELGYSKRGVRDEFYLDSVGNLIVYSDDVDKYSIDGNGNLTTTKDFCGNLIP